MEAVKILQVVGFKNSGKTTLIARLIEQAKGAGKTVSVIKHHGHGGDLAMPDRETDSMRFFEAGAASSIAYGEGVVQMHMRQDNKLEQFIELSMIGSPDVILIEGFKGAPYPKIVMVRNEEDWLELKGLTKVKLAVVHNELELEHTRTIHLEDAAGVERYFVEWMGR